MADVVYAVKVNPREDWQFVAENAVELRKLDGVEIQLEQCGACGVIGFEVDDGASRWSPSGNDVYAHATCSGWKYPDGYLSGCGKVYPIRRRNADTVVFPA